MNKAKEIIKILTPYLMAFPQSKMNEGALLVYARALEELELEQIEASMQMLIKSSKFFPTVAEIYEKVELVTNTIKRDIGDEVDLSPAEAWENAMATLKSTSPYSREPYIFANEKVERAVRQFGLSEMLMLEQNAVNTARAQFMKIYGGLLQRGRQEKEAKDALHKIGNAKVKALIEKVSDNKVLRLEG